MAFFKKNYGWLIVSVLATLPLIPLVKTGFDGGKENIDMLYHISGEFSIRWMTAVLTCTPFFILFGVTNLFVRQAMGIATAVWSLLHFILFIWAEGFLETFTQFNYVAGFVAVLLLIPLLLTSNRISMRFLKTNWKKLQRFAYLIIFLSLLHIAILDKTWLIYAIIVGIGFIIRIPFIKHNILQWRQNRKAV
ncbi:ferric reductase [Wenyingzhuangia sp. 2_MG-2023]|uniref:ferric reductase n=1 Tax=Wenyingzhuangia sp. 2_MG-2023 TaxID=3062639 RepID=UPI0026E26162|nr:ferric reductase [Wenyingzhuangia sp. 2_MG-2023]MDO6737340.1 ferric reductase [Wenyingzhuangia sp. 2_MG-2023]